MQGELRNEIWKLQINILFNPFKKLSSSVYKIFKIIIVNKGVLVREKKEKKSMPCNLPFEANVPGIINYLHDYFSVGLWIAMIKLRTKM